MHWCNDQLIERSEDEKKTLVDRPLNLAGSSMAEGIQFLIILNI